MDRTERFYKIELLLKSRGCVSFAALRSELAVSPATLKRDLQYLRERMDAPIVYDRLDDASGLARSDRAPENPFRGRIGRSRSSSACGTTPLTGTSSVDAR